MTMTEKQADKIIDLLEIIAGNTNPIERPEGFVDSSVELVICNPNECPTMGWGLIDRTTPGSPKIVEAPTQRLDGRITKVVRHHKKYSKPVKDGSGGTKTGADVLRVYLRAGTTTYIIESSLSSTFSRNFMLSACQLTKQDFEAGFFSIVVEVGDEGGLFCRLYKDGGTVERLQVEGSWRDFRWEPVFDKVFALFPQVQRQKAKSTASHSSPQPASQSQQRQQVATYTSMFTDLADRLSGVMAEVGCPGSYTFDDVEAMHQEFRDFPEIDQLSAEQLRQLLDEVLISWGSLTLGQQATALIDDYKEISEGVKNRVVVQQWIEFVKMMSGAMKQAPAPVVPQNNDEDF